MDNGTSAAIRPLTGEFKDATLEREFVASTWPAVARQTHLAGLLGAAVYLLASYIDYVGLGLVPAYYGLLAVRTMVAVAMVGFVAASLWRRDPQFTQVGALGIAAPVVVGLLTCAIV